MDRGEIVSQQLLNWCWREWSALKLTFLADEWLRTAAAVWGGLVVALAVAEALASVCLER